MAEKAIYDQLVAIPAFGDRVYPLVLPQNVEYPAAVYTRLSAPRYPTMNRSAGVDVEATIQVDIYTRRMGGYTELNALSQTVQRVFNQSGMSIFVDNDRDDYEDDTELLRKSYDVRVWYTET